MNTSSLCVWAVHSTISEQRPFLWLPYIGRPATQARENQKNWHRNSISKHARSWKETHQESAVSTGSQWHHHPQGTETCAMEAWKVPRKPVDSGWLVGWLFHAFPKFWGWPFPSWMMFRMFWGVETWNQLLDVFWCFSNPKMKVRREKDALI